MKKNSTLTKYFIEGSIVFLSVFFSFYLTDVKRLKSMKESKNVLLKDLSNSMIEDTLQITGFIDARRNILESLRLIRDDIDSNHTILNDDEFFNEFSNEDIGRTFMSRNGIFNQMISTGNIELIENEKLKYNLIEVFNHLKARNESITKIIDETVYIHQLPLMNEMFRIKLDVIGNKAIYGNKKVEKYYFNKSFYLSNKFYQIINSNIIYTSGYIKLLEEMLKKYGESINLIQLE